MNGKGWKWCSLWIKSEKVPRPNCVIIWKTSLDNLRRLHAHENTTATAHDASVCPASAPYPPHLIAPLSLRPSAHFSSSPSRCDRALSTNCCKLCLPGATERTAR